MANNLLPFRLGTRQRRAKVGSVAFAAGQAVQPFTLPQVGMLARLILQFRGTVTLSAAGALADLGPWSILNNVQVSSNIGAAAIASLSGYGAFMLQQKLPPIGGYRPNLGGAGSTTPNADIHSAPVAMGANTWVQTFIIPIAANDGDQFGIGAINLQSPETRVQVAINCGNTADVATNVTGITGTWHLYYEYYEIPDPSKFALPPLALHRCLEEQQPISATGDNVYTVPRQGTLLQLLHRVSLNGARSDSVDEFRIVFNKTDTVYREERQWERILERFRNGVDPITGVFEHDFWNAQGMLSYGDTRDAIDTEELTTLESFVTITAGAGLGANNNTLASVRRIVQMLQQ